jgi:hypothetical protein
LKTSACKCAKEFANFCQISTKNLRDKEGAYLPGVLKEIVEVIIAALKISWLVYIHCNSGIHRAPSCAVALLLIGSKKLSFDDAVKFVVNSRSAAFKGLKRNENACAVFLDQLNVAFREATHRAPRNIGGRSTTLPEPPLQEWTPFHRLEGCGAAAGSAALCMAEINAAAGAGAGAGAACHGASAGAGGDGAGAGPVAAAGARAAAVGAACITAANFYSAGRKKRERERKQREQREREQREQWKQREQLEREQRKQREQREKQNKPAPKKRKRTTGGRHTAGSED